MTSSSTTSLGGRGPVPEPRRTVGLACPTMASLSRVCLARSSWMMPIALLAMISRPNSPLMSDPVASTMRKSTPRMALMRVKILDLTMSDTLRAARVGHVIGLAVGDPLSHLGIGQTGGRGCGGHRVKTPLPAVS